MVRKHRLCYERCVRLFQIVFLVFFLFLKRSLQNNFFLSANEASYYGAFDRARNADLDAIKIEFLVDNRSPLVPKQGREGSSVPQHDLFSP